VRLAGIEPAAFLSGAEGMPDLVEKHERGC
jgi:hypothetical protein